MTLRNRILKAHPTTHVLASFLSQGGEDAFPSVSDSSASPSRPVVRPKEPAESKNNSHGPRMGIYGLALGTLGVVYGDIGTSPLYTIKECFHGLHAIPPSETNIMGVLSLVFWSLTVVVSIKYILFLLRTDNKGEGGVYALLGLIPEDGKKISARTRSAVVIIGIVGASALYGDGVITPAITVLSSIEGLEVATKAAAPMVIPLTCLILLALFLFQYRGTAAIGKVFGPVMLLWFLTIGLLGAWEVIRHPRVLQALNPLYAVRFFHENGFRASVVLGSVVLCITGAEALYADLGHFGKSAIRLSWLGLAFPSLLLNYYGQGALLLDMPEMAFNPFYGLTPKSLLYPMVGLSTFASVIASQAMISGIFSLTQQAVQLGYFPRVLIVHTSAQARGQIYVPVANYLLMLGCLGVVLAFRESGRLAGAYGLAVTATMGITSILYFFVLTRTKNWSFLKAFLLVGTFLVFDLGYFGANILKVVDGGWFTALAAGLVAFAMITWRDGRAALARRLLSSRLPITTLIQDLARQKPVRVSGTAVFMTLMPTGTPSTLLHHLKHNRVLHEKVILLSIRSADTPFVPRGSRLTVEELGEGFIRVIATYGFMEVPNAPEILQAVDILGVPINPAAVTFYLGKETLLTTGDSRMWRWRKEFFAFMSRNAQNARNFFRIPPNQVIEIGAHVEL